MTAAALADALAAGDLSSEQITQAHLDRIEVAGALRPLVHRAGLRADVLVTGTIA